MKIEIRQGDVNSLDLEGIFDLAHSFGTVQYIEPENRIRRFEHLKERTTLGGINTLLTVVDHPEVPPAPNWGDKEYLYAFGELRGCYEGWECLHERGFVSDDDSGD